jgi:BolA protein
MNPNSDRVTLLRERLTEALHPSLLEIIDETHRHKNHPGGKTGLGHFVITIASPLFKNKSTLECHRIVYDALGTLMQTDIHSLKIKIVQSP